MLILNIFNLVKSATYVSLDVNILLVTRYKQVFTQPLLCTILIYEYEIFLFLFILIFFKMITHVSVLLKLYSFKTLLEGIIFLAF